MFKRLLRPIFNKLASLLGIPEIQGLVRNLQVQSENEPKLKELQDSWSLHIEKRLSDTVKVQILDTTKALQDKFYAHVEAFTTERNAALQDKFYAHVEAFTTERNAALQEGLDFHFRRIMADFEIKMQRSIDVTRAVLNSGQESVGSPSHTTPKSTIDDGLYMLLEDYFRGSPEIVKTRQSQYIPFIASVVSSEFPLVDLGCGRGEWLEVLKGNSIPASGVDSNQVSIHDCRGRGLSVSQGDLVTFLQQTPAASLGAVTMFQVLEHLPFPVLVDVLRLVLKALKPGGVFIAEVPNSETLSVGATTFWIDPTHEKPLFPNLLKFLVKQVGYTKVEGIYSTPLRDAPDLLGLTETDREVVLDLFNQVYGPGDFAFIATA